jgi:hypothetical protein
MKNILLGFEIKTGKKVEIPLSHLIATGVTQLSGKTTTLEALIKRSGLKAIVFKTKIGETGFSEGTVIPPYFKEKSDWQYVQSLLEATLKERLKFERSWIIEACKNANSLLEVKANIDKKLAEGKLSGLSRSIYTTLQAYFEIVLPQLQYANFSKTLNLAEGINIIDLERFKEEIQSLVIRSVLETVVSEMKDVIVVIPEAWRYLPEKKGNPCKWATEIFIRQGATNRNFLFIDSQDMANVDKSPLKQVSTWILGLQTEINEVKHTLDQISLPKRLKPKPEEIMTLKVGHFIVCTPYFTKRIYVQPAWMNEKTAKQIAMGKKSVEDISQPKSLAPYSIQIQTKGKISEPSIESQKVYAKIQQDLVGMREDFFNKIQQLQEYADGIGNEVMKLNSTKQEVDVDDIVSRVLQKVPIFNKNEIISEVLQKVPRMSGSVTYEVSPLEKIQKDFLEEIKNKVILDVKTLNDDEKRVLKFIEIQGKGVNTTNVLEKCLFLATTSGSSRQKVVEIFKKLQNLQITRYDAGHGSCFPELKNKIRNMLSTFNASEQEIEQVYNFILNELLNGGNK